ncbi:DUF3299 domain-containing protein [uncultured Pelagimonas sp.]|uniref:DUF3299 domain-containing protein n=1 Tax=uncultured Pelagimonas sp. TaxID=1618102 RepID=UPI002623F9B8|nr:DUF3299 domain-containing protein [uncultured Pelagimonas sp.]
MDFFAKLAGHSDKPKALVTRRSALAGFAVLPLLGGRAWAKEIIDLDWADLASEDQISVPYSLRGEIDHTTAPLSRLQPASGQMRPDWNGKTVRMRGFVVPIDFTGSGVTAFILVPFVGACVHVPPPPANQLVFVTTKTPFESSGLFEAVYVTGQFGVSSLTTEFADVGYAMAADKIEPFSF